MNHQHDCDGCRSLGSFQRWDLYHCPGALGGSLLARFGPKPHEYASWDLDTAQSLRELLRAGRDHSTHSPAMLEALKRHEESGSMITQMEIDIIKGRMVLVDKYEIGIYVVSELDQSTLLAMAEAWEGAVEEECSVKYLGLNEYLVLVILEGVDLSEDSLLQEALDAEDFGEVDQDETYAAYLSTRSEP